MTDYTQQRDVILGIVAGIDGVGRVHTTPRWGDFYELYVDESTDPSRILGWEIGLDEPGTETWRAQQGHVSRRRWWAIRGYVGLENEPATYDLINELALAIQRAIDADQTLSDTCLEHDTVQTSEPVPITIGGGPLCWGVTLRFYAYDID